MNSDEVAAQAVLLLAEAVAGDLRAAVRRLVEITPSPADGFAACCGLANVIAACAVVASPPGADGPLLVELGVAPGADPAEVARDSQVMSDVAGFIAGVGNSDYRGAQIIFNEACCSELGRRGPVFMLTLLKMAAACARDATAGGAT